MLLSQPFQQPANLLNCQKKCSFSPESTDMAKMVSILLVWSLGASLLMGQATFHKPVAKGLIYTRERAFGADFHTAGLGLSYSAGHIKNYDLTPYWLVELSRLKHPKEYKQTADISGVSNSRPFSYGKQNVFFVLHLLRGRKRYLSEKADMRGVAVGWTYAYGLSLGLLKPYYLNLRIDFDPANPQAARIITQKYSADNRDVFLDNRMIVGAAPFTKGLSETKLLPGLHGRIGVLFDWGAFDEMVKSVDVGIRLDLFPKAVPIMVETRNYPFFLNLYLHFQFGKRE